MAGLVVTSCLGGRRWRDATSAQIVPLAAPRGVGRGSVPSVLAAIGLMIAAVLDMILDVARDRGRGPPGPGAPAREDRAS